ncbi:MAG: thioesterase family protein [Henriciella sp.]|uniref:thioesterase family protein n=1 Tax=Henriciella sp. TaxID=1968823 RepID=UPI003C722964
MNLFFRLLFVFLRAHFSKKDTDPFDETEIRSRVMLTDQDMFAHMTNSRYFSFSDLATTNFIIRTNFWSRLRKRGWVPVVTAESVTFVKSLRAHQAFSVKTKLVGWDEKYICLEHDFIHKGQKTARVRIVARFASRTKGERVMMSDVVNLLGVDRQSPPLPDPYRRLIEDIRADRAAS